MNLFDLFERDKTKALVKNTYLERITLEDIQNNKVQHRESNTKKPCRFIFFNMMLV